MSGAGCGLFFSWDEGRERMMKGGRRKKHWANGVQGLWAGDETGRGLMMRRRRRKRGESDMADEAFLDEEKRKREGFKMLLFLYSSTATHVTTVTRFATAGKGKG